MGNKLDLYISLEEAELECGFPERVLLSIAFRILGTLKFKKFQSFEALSSIDNFKAPPLIQVVANEPDDTRDAYWIEYMSESLFGMIQIHPVFEKLKESVEARIYMDAEMGENNLFRPFSIN